jgi:hypothetical protein
MWMIWVNIAQIDENLLFFITTNERLLLNGIIGTILMILV